MAFLGARLALLLLGLAISLAMAFLSVWLLTVEETLADVGLLLLVVWPGALGVLLTAVIHPAYSVVWTMAIAIVGSRIAAAVMLGSDELVERGLLLPLMFMATVLGVSLGDLTRPHLRRLFRL